MSGFYVSLIFIGILLVLFSLVCIGLDKRKVFRFQKELEEKKKELVGIIQDAEQMIDELNKFSDYIVTQMDLKNEEMCKNLKDAEKRIDALGERAKTAEESISTEAVAVGESAAVGASLAVGVSSAIGAYAAVNPTAGSTASNRNTEPVLHSSAAMTSETGIPVRKNDKVIPINNKYSEVIRLSQEGLYGYEIAKKLNMGKGEVELILGLRK